MRGAGLQIVAEEDIRLEPAFGVVALGDRNDPCAAPRWHTGTIE
jgi:hypothetical protein